MNARTVVAAILTVALAAAPARALDVNDVACTCTDGALNRGDVVACVARLSLRLVENGSLDQRGRLRLIHLAQRGRLVPPPDCGGQPPAGSLLEPLTYGAGAHLDRAFYAVGDIARVRLEVWNHSADVVRFAFPTQGGRGCEWDFEIFDDAGQLVHVEPAACADAPTLIDVPPGTTFTQEVDLPLVAIQSEAGQPDGSPLPAGVYHVMASLTQEGFPRFGFTGGLAPIRIE